MSTNIWGNQLMITLDAVRGINCGTTFNPFRGSIEFIVDDPTKPCIIDLEPLKYHNDMTVALQFSIVSLIDGANSATVQFQRYSDTLQSNTYLRKDYEVSNDEPKEIRITGVDRAQIYLYAKYPLDSVPARQERNPADFLAVEVFAPRPDSDALRWNKTRWNRTVWNTAETRTNTLHWHDTNTAAQDKWNRGRWHGGVDSYQWTSIIGPATEVTITRGVTGLSNGAEPGTMTVESLDGLDPRTLGISVGAPVRAYIWDTRELLFTGSLASATVTPTKPGAQSPYTARLEFVDAAAILAATTRYGAKPETESGYDTWRERVHRVMKSSTETRYQIHADADSPCPPAVWETSLTNYLDALAASTAGYWSVERDNSVSISAQPPETEPVAISDTYTIPGLYYTGLEMTWNTSEIVSSVESTTHPAVFEDGEWRADDQTITVENLSTSAAWTGQRLSVDLMTAAGEPQEEATRRLLKRAQTIPPIESLTLRSDHTTWDESTQIARLDPMTSAKITHRGETYDTRIKTITHHLTPKTWTTTLVFNN